jgi:DnaK suppressor protein
VSKPPAKAEAASTTAAKTAKAPVSSPAPKAANAGKPAVKTAEMAPVTAAVKTLATPAPRTSKASKTAPPPPPSAPSPLPISNRFTDRFAPARPASRAMTDTADWPRTAHKPDPKLANAWKTKAGRDLTEPELLAMPEAEYMNEKQLDFFRARLQQQRDDLLSNAGETTEHLREDTSIVPDPADRATIEEEHALELRTRDRERKLLKKIAQSLGRLDSGDYGFCDETGEPIGLQRLMARPTATLSLEAQQRRELKQKMFGD